MSLQQQVKQSANSDQIIQMMLTIVKFSKQEKMERYLAGDDPNDIEVELGSWTNFHDLHDYLANFYPKDITDRWGEPLKINAKFLEEIEDWCDGYFHLDVKKNLYTMLM